MNYSILVNKDNKLRNKYIPKNLVEYKEYNGEKIDKNAKTLVVKDVLEAFNIMNKDAQKENIYFIIDSCYRSYEYQEKIFDYNVELYGIEKTKSLVAEPGTSEHQTGLAIDVALKINDKYTDKFDDTYREIKWLHNNCYKYGFILRYPKRKEKVTGYNYEYWHIRYVGKNISNLMHKNNILTLEEFYNKSI